MSELTAESVIDWVRRSSVEEKETVLSELVRDKWHREGRNPSLFLPSNEKPQSGFCFIFDPAIPSTMPPLNEADWAAIQSDMKNLDDALTTAEAKAYLRQAVARRYGK